jgi:ferredoxin--NADP+ reductase
VLERSLERQNVRFFGNVDVGGDVSLAELRESYDAVLVAVGVGEDRRLRIPGETLDQVVGSWDFISWINGRPGHDTPPVDLAGVRKAVVIGLGNVALDVARLLVKGGAESGSDIVPEAAKALAAAPLEQIVILGRGSSQDARFGYGELQELLSLPRVGISVTGDCADSTSAIGETIRNSVRSGTPELLFRFRADPAAVVGSGRAEAVRVRSGGEEEAIPADLVVTCIGFSCVPLADLDQQDGRFQHDENRIAPDLFVAGWAATGPTGTIASSRSAAFAVADRMNNEVHASSKSGIDLERVRHAVDLSGWRRIDAAERTAAGDGRVRTKFRTIEAMLNVARGGDQVHGESAAQAY